MPALVRQHDVHPAILRLADGRIGTALVSATEPGSGQLATGAAIEADDEEVAHAVTVIAVFAFMATLACPYVRLCEKVKVRGLM